jgi:hypothetical protein
LAWRNEGRSGNRLGDSTTYGSLYNDALAHFSEGGVKYVASRVVGPGATAGTAALDDQATSPILTLTINAANPGAWSSNLTYQVLPGPITNTFNLVFTYTGAQSQIIETYTALQSPAAAVAQVNAVSNFVTLVNAGSVTAAPNDNPAVMAEPATLTAGTDDRTNVNTSVLVAGLQVFSADLGSGVVAIPGQPASLVEAGLQAHASANSRIALSAPPAGQTVSEVESLVKTLIGQTGGQSAGLMWPWVLIPNGNGGTVTISPEGAIAGLRATVQAATGPWQPPAGGNGVFRFVVGTELTVGQSDANTLDAAGVSVIRQIGGAPRLYGWRSLSADLINFPLLKDQDTINFIVVQANSALERYVFQTIDGLGQLFGLMTATVKNILVPIATAGGLYPAYDSAGNLVDPGYTIDTSAAINTPQTLAQNEARIAVGVRISPAASMVQFLLTKMALTSAA